MRREETFEGGVGVADVGRRGKRPSREVHQVSAPVGEDRRQRGRCRFREAWQGPLRKEAPPGCVGNRRPEAAWTLPIEGAVARASSGRYTNYVRRLKMAGVGVGIADVGRRGKGPYRGRNHWVHRSETTGGGVGVFEVRRRGRGTLLEDAPTRRADMGRPESAWALQREGSMGIAPPG